MDGITSEDAKETPFSAHWMNVELIRINRFYPKNTFISRAIAEKEVERMNAGVFLAAEYKHPNKDNQGKAVQRSDSSVDTTNICAVLRYFRIAESMKGDCEAIHAKCLVVQRVRYQSIAGSPEAEEMTAEDILSDISTHPYSSFGARGVSRTITSAYASLQGQSIQRIFTFDYMGKDHTLRDPSLVLDQRPVTAELFT